MMRLARKLLPLLILVSVVVGAHAGPDPQAILVASDIERYPTKPFSVDTQLLEYRDGKLSDTNTLQVYSKIDPKTGQFRSLVRYLAPARDINKLILYNGNDMWFYDPSSKASVQLSPRQRLLGQASNGDVVNVNLAVDYQATSAKEEDILDGDMKKRHCIKLELSAKTPSATYHRIEQWVGARDMRPVKARFYSESGSMLKTAYYRRYQKQLGGDRPTETVIIDGLNPHWVTVMRFYDWQWREIPDAWLQRSYLPHFRPQ
jgi:hypothetical protein